MNEPLDIAAITLALRRLTQERDQEIARLRAENETLRATVARVQAMIPNPPDASRQEVACFDLQNAIDGRTFR